MRLFVAVWPSPEVRDVLAALERQEHPSVRWTPPEQWHITLRFFGEVADDDVPALTGALRAVGAQQPAVRADLGPTTRRLGRGVLVVPVSGLDGLGDAVVEATRSFGEPPPERSFNGHVTLARARRGRPVPADLGGQAVAASWLVDEVTLVRSTLDEVGARYETVASVPLGAASASAR